MEAHVPYHLLAIDDDVMFLEIVRHHLEKIGICVEVASDPHLGLNRAIETQFDLILLDLMMPGLNGEDVLRLLKPLGVKQRILVVSGHTGPSYRSRARDLGAVGYLEKPISSDALCLAVRDVLESGRRSEGVGQTASNSILEILTGFVFGVGQQTNIKKMSAVGVLCGLVGIFIWLIFGA